MEFVLAVLTPVHWRLLSQRWNSLSLRYESLENRSKKITSMAKLFPTAVEDQTRGYPGIERMPTHQYPFGSKTR
jgi:hypothetical protein